MISRRIVGVSLALALGGSVTYAAFANQNSSVAASIRARIARLEAKQHQLEKQLAEKTNKHKTSPRADFSSDAALGTDAIVYFGGTPIVTSPYVGLRTEYDGSHLITNLSSSNEDMRLLMQRYAFDSELRKLGKPLPEHPLIELSGKLEGLVNYYKPFSGPTVHDVDLATAELDTAVHVSRAIMAFLALKFDGAASIYDRRVDNSRLYVEKGFITVGDLSRTPFYATIGQMYVPFGRYAGFMISAPLPMTIGRTKARPILLGYKNPADTGLFAQTYYFRGDTDIHHGDNGGVNVGYDFKSNGFSGSVSTSFIYNMVDSNGMQHTGRGPEFPGFAVGGSAESLVHGVRGWSINGKVSKGPITVLAEYLGAINRFDVRDLSYNNVGARPAAIDAQVAYMFRVHDKPTNIALGYDHTTDSLALNVPKNRYIAALNTSIWKNTIETLEYRYDKNYAATDTASGRGGVAPFPTAGLGATSQTLTLQIGAYF